MSNPRSGAPKRVAAGLLAGALSVFGLAFAPSAGAAATVTTERFAGEDRYDTARLIAANAAFAAPKSAIVATGQNFPDALAASTLAGTLRPAPIVLTATASLSPAASAALTALKGKGVTGVHIAGGTSAVSQATEDAIKALGLTVTRQQGTGAGANRYGTAAQIATAANAISPTGSIGGLKAAFFATGLNFADAVAAAPGAYAARIPVLLVNADVPAETSAAITSLGIKKAYVLGGIGAVPDAVAAKLATATGNTVTRIEGTAAAGSSQDRFGTAAAIADFEVASLGFANPTSAIIANGTDAKQGVDALASGPLGGEVKAPVLLVASCPPATTAWLDKNSPTLTKLFYAGGEQVVDAATATCTKDAAQTVSNDKPNGVTVRPELVGAKVISTTPTGVQAGTVVRYSFDDNVVVAGATLGAFHAISSDGATRYDGDVITAVTGDPTSVDITFTDAPLLSPATAGDLTVATVDFGAILTGGAVTNPEGDASLNSANSSPLSAGITSAPDVQSIGNFRSANATQTFVDFVFDEVVAASAGGTPYHLLALDGTTVKDCAFDHGVGTTTVTVVCTNAPTLGTLNPASYARGWIDPATVTGAPAGGSVQNQNVQAADISASGNTTGPDVVSASITLGNGVSTNDSIVVVFDQNITSADVNMFKAYKQVAGTPIAPAAATTSGVTPTNVLLTFAPGSLNTAVGMYVLPAAVIANGGVNPNQPNLQDEVGASNSATSTQAAGKTGGPDLVSVKRVAATDAFLTPTGGYNVIYTFDEALSAAAPVSAKFFLYTANGTQLTASNCVIVPAVAPATTTSSVSCGQNGNAAISGYGATPSATVATAVLGTVDDAAIASLVAGPSNPEGAEAVS